MNLTFDLGPFSFNFRKGLIAATVASVVAVGCDSGGSGVDTSGADGAYKFTIAEDDLVIGSPDAKVTLVEYSSFTCPHCAAFHAIVFPTLKKDYLDTGQAKFVFRHYPLDNAASKASLLVRCAPQDKQLAIVDALYTRQYAWIKDSGGPISGLTKIAREAMISEEAFSNCTRDEAMIDSLETQRNEGTSVYEINATPTIFVNGNKTQITSVADLHRIMADLVESVE